MIPADWCCIDEERVSMGFDLIFFIFFLIKKFFCDFMGLGLESMYIFFTDDLFLIKIDMEEDFLVGDIGEIK